MRLPGGSGDCKLHPDWSESVVLQRAPATLWGCHRNSSYWGLVVTFYFPLLREELLKPRTLLHAFNFIKFTGLFLNVLQLAQCISFMAKVGYNLLCKPQYTAHHFGVMLGMPRSLESLSRCLGLHCP